MSDWLMLFLRALPALAAFAGFSALLCVRFDIDRCVAPLLAACGIILCMTLAGMIRLLRPACYALYALGFAALICACLNRRAAFPRLLLPASLAFTALLALRFANCPLNHIDDFSHWGRIVRFLMLRDRLPVEGDLLLTHSSYPPGSACFIYFFARPIGPSDAAYLVAQNFLYGVALLPLFSCVRRGNRRALSPIVAFMAFMLLSYPFMAADLLVDELQTFFCVGAIATVARYRNEPRRALFCSLPILISVALFKNSGLFFSFVAALALIYAARRRWGRGARLRRLSWTALLAPVLVYLLWALRVKLCFPSVGASAHAISLTAFAGNFAAKGLQGVEAVAKSMAAGFAKQSDWRLRIELILILSLAMLLFLSFRLPARARRAVRHGILYAFAVYALWLLLLFGMYVFSMSGVNAQTASSFSRYNASGYTCATCILFLLLMLALQRSEARPLRPLLRCAGALCAAGLACALALMVLPGAQTRMDAKLMRAPKRLHISERFSALRQQCDLAYGGRYLLYFTCDSTDSSDRLNLDTFITCYELGTYALPTISSERSEPDLLRIGGAAADSEEIQDWLAESAEGCEAILLLDESPAFEAELAAFFEAGGSAIPIYRACGPEPGAAS